MAAVFFVEGNQVAREMRATEFGAFLDGYVGLSDLAETEALLSSRGIALIRKDRKLVVMPEQGQGAFYAFEEGNGE